MNNVVGLIIITIYIGIVIKGSNILSKKKKMKDETNRKLVHVLLSLCFFLAHCFFKTTIIAILLPLLFVIVNILSSHRKWFESFKREEQDLGIVWYALSLLILVYLSFEQKSFFPFASCSVLAMGLSDAIAGLVGTYYGKHQIKVGKETKTLEGSLAFFMTSSIVFMILLKGVFPETYIKISLITSSLAMIIERFSIKGLDNLTVPLSTLWILLIFNYIPLNVNDLLLGSILILLGDYCYHTHKLTLPGVIVAITLGFTVAKWLGIIPFLALCTFLFSSTILEKIRTNQTKEPKKHERRSAKQVLANGLLAWIFAIGYGLTKQQVYYRLFFITIAASTSDTWSGEIGMMGHEPVKSIITRKPLEKGLSGGVTKLGFLGALLGALTIASFHLIVDRNLFSFLIIIVLGFLSSIIDSIFGDLYQIKYYDPKKKKIKEDKEQHNLKYSGYKYFTNNTVNFLSNLIVCFIYWCTLRI